jgi:hypothetical protein
MNKPTTHPLHGSVIATGASVAILWFGAAGSASANGGSQSFYLNTFASLQKINARVYPLKISHRHGTNSPRRKYISVRCD